MTRILVITAHPDDETLGAGGTLARAVRAGNDVFVCVACDVTTSREPRPGPGVLERRRAEAGEAARILGLAEVINLRLPDQTLDTHPRLSLVKRIRQVAARWRPDVVYTHHPGDPNFDHRVVAEAALAVARPHAGSRVRRLLSFEIPGWTAPLPAVAFLPNVHVEVVRTLDVKLAALRSYRSEARTYPHPRSPRAVRDWARARGAAVGLPAAEAFVLLRELERS
ncbi:MAG: PIG-L family deacetylase [Planctomycetes bacterium]|nr:PIG-L family deacetylase [Planctomycetota bacterium]